MDKLALRLEFEEARQLYPGDKRSMIVEWTYFCNLKRFKGRWSEIVPLLIPAIKRQIEHRKIATGFVAEWKGFKSWIYNSYWTLEFGSKITDEAEILKRRAEVAKVKARAEIGPWLREQTPEVRQQYAIDWPIHQWLVDEIERQHERDTYKKYVTGLPDAERQEYLVKHPFHKWLVDEIEKEKAGG